MILLPQSPKRSLNKAYLKQRPLRSDIDLFKVNLLKLLSKVDEIEREENQKNHIRDFLRDTFFKDHYEVNTKDTKDLVVHLSKSNKAKVAVIIEAKRPTNKAEMITKDNPNAKGLHELILYYFDERNRADNNELKHLIISNVYEWFIFDANFFDKLFYRNTKIKRLYDTYINDKKDTPFFYEEIRKIIPEIDSDLPCAYFDIRDYENILNNKDTDDDKDLIALFKVLSAVNILKLPFADDSNKLDEKFYKELLHIIGLEEVKEKNKLIIRRKIKDAHPGSLIENTINILETEDVIRKVQDISSFGGTKDERLFNIAFELVITWINRILFLKLLEAQLVNYHRGDKEYRFLNTQTVEDYDELFKLFHQVLARTPENRTESIRKKYGKVPYLNSSLFEISELEDKTIKINSLDDSEKLELINNTVLKEERKKTSSMPALEYLFRFLDAYDFASEGAEDIQEDSKTLINASVLGKVFEKINGYKDGSIFTPGFITMYMCRQAIRLAVLQKFKDKYGWNAKKFEDLSNYFYKDRSSTKIKEHNSVINSIRICDPAVGSGHFLVSSLNEIIAVKSELGILADETGMIIRNFDITVENDELIVTDYDGDIFEYTVTSDKAEKAYSVNKEVQRLQKTLFHEKQAIIENCLFGVDINPNSVKICRLRLWIELLKNAYYREEGSLNAFHPEGSTSPQRANEVLQYQREGSTYVPEVISGEPMKSSQTKSPRGTTSLTPNLETLPNIDINIKCGNSLISRFPLDADLGKALKKTGYTIDEYRGFVSGYRNEKSRDKKRELQNIIDSIKNDFRTEILSNDPKLLKLNKLNAELDILVNQEELFEESAKEKKSKKDTKDKLEKEIKKLTAEIDEIKTNVIYRNAFEWRFEFPEVLNEQGEFEGFDVVIGNPPYIRHEEIGYIKPHLRERYEVYIHSGDLFFYFYELALNLLKRNGKCSFINNTFDKTSSGTILRQFISDNFSVLKYIDFTSVNIFDGATTYPIIIISEKNKQLKHFQYFKFSEVNFQSKEVLYDERVFSEIPGTYLRSQAWSFVGGGPNKILKKLSTYPNLYEIYGKSFRGIITGLNDAFIVSHIEDSTGNLYPVYEGKDVKKWHCPISEKRIIVFRAKSTKTDLKETSEEKALQIMKVNHPTIFRHLELFQEAAKKRFDKGEFWWELRNCAYYDLFDKPKIIFPNLQNSNKFAYDVSGSYINAPAVFLPTEDKSLTAILNSKVVWYFLKSICVVRSGGYIEVKPQYFEQIPIPTIDEEEKTKLTKLVNKIIERVKCGEEVKELEREIDLIVYSLYNLNEDEINIVEVENLKGT